MGGVPANTETSAVKNLRVRPRRRRQRCLFFVLFGRRRCLLWGARLRPSIFPCGHRPATGFRHAKPVTPVQLRLTAPFFQPLHTRRAPAAQSGLQNPTCPEHHPGRRALFLKGLWCQKKHGRLAPGRRRSVTARVHHFSKTHRGVKQPSDWSHKPRHPGATPGSATTSI